METDAKGRPIVKIQITKDLANKLKARMKIGDTYDSVIRDLLKVK